MLPGRRRRDTEAGVTGEALPKSVPLPFLRGGSVLVPSQAHRGTHRPPSCKLPKCRAHIVLGGWSGLREPLPTFGLVTLWNKNSKCRRPTQLCCKCLFWGAV